MGWDGMGGEGADGKVGGGHAEGSCGSPRTGDVLVFARLLGLFL
jgi:hypothetical protein